MPDKICLSCEDFVVITAEAGYSDDTPGWDVEIYCRKRHWKIDQFVDTEDDYEQKMMSAENCKDYKRRCNNGSNSTRNNRCCFAT